MFEMESGVKCQVGRFNSDRFVEFVEREVHFDASVHDLRDLVLATDLLRDRYTLCGQSILETPYYTLMAELANGCVSSDSDYVIRCRLGRLDSRPPLEPDLGRLQDCYEKRMSELADGRRFYIYVRCVKWRGRPVFAIADGKHRAALAAYLGCPERLVLRVVSRDVLEEPFFKNVYEYVLRLDPREYSINQEMIKAIRYGQ